MEIKTGTFNFPPATGERTARISFVFSHPIAEAHVALSGYRAEYVKSDRQIQRMVVRLSTEIGGRVDEGWVATVLARFNLRDQNEEHAFSGAIDFVLFAEIQDFALESSTSTAFAMGGMEGLDPQLQTLSGEDSEPEADHDSDLEPDPEDDGEKDDETESDDEEESGEADDVESEVSDDATDDTDRDETDPADDAERQTGESSPADEVGSDEPGGGN